MIGPPGPGHRCHLPSEIEGEWKWRDCAGALRQSWEPPVTYFRDRFGFGARLGTGVALIGACFWIFRPMIGSPSLQVPM